VGFTDKSGQAIFHNRVGADRLNAAFPILNFYTDFANSTRDTYSWSGEAPSSLDSFINGSLGMFFGFNYHDAIIKARNPQLNFEIISMLQLSPDQQPANVANYWVQAVTEKSKNKNEAWNLINYLAHSKATKEYLDATNRPSALRAYIGDQKEKPELAPFASQVLFAENWYKGKNYESAMSALDQMVKEWLLPAPTPGRENEYRQEVLNRAAARFNQTL
ncbi:MAG: hypothetical protein AAB348_01620, partial [Patescibacteria group bacterium]